MCDQHYYRFTSISYSLADNHRCLTFLIWLFQTWESSVSISEWQRYACRPWGTATAVCKSQGIDTRYRHECCTGEVWTCLIEDGELTNTGVLTCRPASPIKLLTKSTARASLELKYVLELKQGCESVEILRIPLAPELSRGYSMHAWYLTEARDWQKVLDPSPSTWS